MLLHLCTRRLARAQAPASQTDRRPLSGLRGPVAPPISQSVAEKKAWVVFGAGPRKRDPGPPPKSLRDTQVPRRAALGDHFFQDGALRRDPASVSHFELLGLPKGLDVDDDALDEGLRVLQRRLHPDRFATSTQEQRDLADAASARVNGATAVLRDDLRRADYLLLLETGTSVLDDETRTAPPALLMEVMEVREAIDEATDGGALEALVAANDARIVDANARLRESGGDL